MTEEELQAYYREGHSCKAAAYLRFFLMAFVCFWSFGFPEPTGIISSLSGFAAPAFFILSGYFVLTKNEISRQKKTVRKIKKTLRWFTIVLLCYVLVNIAVCLINHIAIKFSRRIVFNFLVLNLWPLPIGRNIWFMQALLYAYLFIFIADKLRLMKFYKVIMVLTFLFMLLSGEFAGLIHFNVLGYSYIPGNWFTRALPYLLLGMLMRENDKFLLKIKTWKYLVIFLMGGLFVIGELFLLRSTGLLVYEGHMIGYGIMAFAVCGWAVTHPQIRCLQIPRLRIGRSHTGRLRIRCSFTEPSLTGSSPITKYDTAYSSLIYSFMEPVYYVLFMIGGSGVVNALTLFGGLASYAVSVILSICILALPLWHKRQS